MSKRDGKVTVLPTAFPPLDRTACGRCGALGITVIAVTTGPDWLPVEHLYCGPNCASYDGWPWLPPRK